MEEKKTGKNIKNNNNRNNNLTKVTHHRIEIQSIVIMDIPWFDPKSISIFPNLSQYIILIQG